MADNTTYCKVPEEKQYTEQVRRWSRNTRANGDEMGADIEKLLNNDAYLKEKFEELDGNAVKDGEKGTAGGVATLDDEGKLVQHVEYGNVDNVPAPKWDKIEGKPISYPPSSHTHNKSAVGLGNVDNTADSEKSVKYATSAGNADTVDNKHASAFALSGHTHPAATTSAAGLMSAADKKKLDGVATGANAYSHPTSAGNKHIPAGGSSGQILRWSADGTAAWGADNNTTYSAATTSAAGLMSAADKKKLDGVATGANVTPSGLSSGYVRTGLKPGTTVGGGATAEGYHTTASGAYSHAEGCFATTSGEYSHAEGSYATASANHSHAEGSYTTASGTCSHAEGGSTTASGEYSHAEGNSTEASGRYSHAAGYCTIAKEYQFVIGSHNVEKEPTGYSNSGDRFIVGCGTSSTKKNIFRVHSGGVYGVGAYNASGADYAEYFEWIDGNPDNEDRRGYFVTLEGDKIKVASPGDYIIGIVSSTASVIGNSYDDQWAATEITDDWGQPIVEEFVVPAEYQELKHPDGTTETIMIRPETKELRPRLNPQYDKKRKYVGRSERPEWAPVGMLGVLRVRDDGTCQINGYCHVTNGGIATADDDGYRVIARITDNIIKIVFR